jgi:hypothetical protein
MAYIIKIKYLSTQNRFNLPNSIKKIDTDHHNVCKIGEAILNTLTKYNDLSTIYYDTQTGCELYIVYHNISDFFHGNGIRRNHFFAQYIYMDNHDLRNDLMQRYRNKTQSLLTEKDYFFDFCDRVAISEDVSTEFLNDAGKTKCPQLPMIHITTLDLFDEKHQERLQKQGIVIPRYIKYLDSSIWNQYVPLERDNGDFYKHLKIAITNIVRYTEQGLYKDSKIQAIADFNARLLINSHLESTEDKHATYVSPFVFHSETEMKGKSVERIEEINNIYNVHIKEINNIYSKHAEKLEWRILLIDDNTSQNTNTDSIKVDKVLKQVFLQIEDITVNIESATNIKSAIEKNKEKKYDIILVDYLLGYKDKDDKTKGREYGYEFLDKIKMNNVFNDVEVGIFGKFWIMFTSAFRNAVRERLQEKGYTYNEQYWHIARGACPLTAPELFRYNFITFIFLQLNVITKLYLSNDAQKALENTDRRIITVIDLLKQIFKELAKVRERAIGLFDALLKMRANYNILKYDAKYKENNEYGSKLIQRLFKDIDDYNNAFWEHLQHLVYLTAFGTIRQWTEMWEEYLFVKKYIKDKDVLIYIEKYIISLKNDNFS